MHNIMQLKLGKRVFIAQSLNQLQKNFKNIIFSFSYTRFDTITST